VGELGFAPDLDWSMELQETGLGEIPSGIAIMRIAGNSEFLIKCDAL